MVTQEPEQLTPRETVKAMAKELGFDFLYPPLIQAKYFVLCNYESGQIEAFDANEHGYGLALAWLKEVQIEPEIWIGCSNCDERTKGRCSKCDDGLCFDCNLLLNMKDDERGNSQDDGLCWKCREIKAGTYIGD